MCCRHLLLWPHWCWLITLRCCLCRCPGWLTSRSCGGKAGGRVAALGPVVAGGVIALGLSAFFWLPVLAERSYVADSEPGCCPCLPARECLDLAQLSGYGISVRLFYCDSFPAGPGASGAGFCWGYPRSALGCRVAFLGRPCPVGLPGNRHVGAADLAQQPNAAGGSVPLAAALHCVLEPGAVQLRNCAVSPSGPTASGCNLGPVGPHPGCQWGATELGPTLL